MELFPSKLCRAFTGSLSKSYGYYIRRVGKRFFSQRSLIGPRIRDGHLRFIFSCAQLAQSGIILSNIKVPIQEFTDALIEAGLYDPHAKHDKWSILPPQMDELDFHDVLNFKTFHGL